jgi:hypothetical protein
MAPLETRSAIDAKPPAPRWPQSAWPGAPFLEVLFNPAGQQRGGLLFGLLRTLPGRDRNHPVLRFLARGPFNVNPIFSGYVAGLFAVRLAQEARAAGEPGADGGAPATRAEEADAEEALERIRATLAPVLSGVGDRLVWGGLRPVLSLIGILSAFLWIGEPALWYWVGYNAVQSYWRRRSWRIGRQGEEAVRAELTGPTLRSWTRRLTAGGRFLLGLTIGAVAAGAWSEHGVAWCGIFLGVLGLGFLLARSRRVGPLSLGWIGIALAALVAWARFELWRWVH